MLSAAGAQAEEIAAPGPLNETKPAEVRIVSTEFRYAPAKVIVIAGRAVTLVLDNSGAETEHDLFVSAYGFRMQAKAGETARKSTVFEKPGEYEYSCDLPGHRDAGMKGTLIVRAIWTGRLGFVRFGEEPKNTPAGRFRRRFYKGSEPMFRACIFERFGELLVSFMRAAALPAALCTPWDTACALAQEAQQTGTPAASSSASVANEA